MSVRTRQTIFAALKLDVGELFGQQERQADGRVLRFRDLTSRVFGNGAAKVKLTPRGSIIVKS